MYQLNITKLFAHAGRVHAAGLDFTGTIGNDTQVGTSGNDRFFYDQGGDDTLNGLEGKDTFNMGAAFNANDAIDGGAGDDTIVLNGDYALTLNVTTILDVETIRLTAGHDYSLVLGSASLFNVPTFTFDASALGVNDSSTLDTGPISTGGNIVYKGGDGLDEFRFGRGFSGQFNGAGGDDIVEFARGATSQMLVNGGAGNDTVQIDVFASAGTSPHIALGASAIKSIETLGIVTDEDVSLRMNDGNVAAGKTLVVLTLVNDGAVGLDFDGSREKNGHFDVSGGGLNDVLVGGALSDTFHLNASLAAGGADAVFGEGGDDLIFAGDTLDNADLIDGGTGTDTLYLSGDYSSSANFVPDVIHDVETIVLAAGFNYYLPLNAANIDSNETLTVDASALSPSNVADVRAENSKGHLDATGGAGDDTLIGGDVSDHLVGGAGGDTLVGRLGGDTMQGGAGNDYYFLYQPDNSTGPNYDTFVGFDADVDFIVTRNSVSAVDGAVNAGTLNTASFNADLKTAIGAGQLGGFHAVVFRPDAGSLAGRVFLVIDDNGVAGYQANADFVIDITGAVHLNHLDPSDFGPLIG